MYNALKTLRWEGVHKEIWRDDKVKNVHYILAPKPWDEVDARTGEWKGLDGSNGEKGMKGGRDGRDLESTRWWVEINRERKEDEKRRGIEDEF